MSKKRARSDKKQPEIQVIGVPEDVDQSTNSAERDSHPAKKKSKIDQKSKNSSKPEPETVSKDDEPSVIPISSTLDQPQIKSKKIKKQKKQLKSGSGSENLQVDKPLPSVVGDDKTSKIVDHELDGLFKSSTFLALPVSSSKESTTISKPQPVPAIDTEISVKSVPEQSSSPPNLRVHTETKAASDVSTSEEARLAMKHAQRFAKSLRQGVRPSSTHNSASVPTSVSAPATSKKVTSSTEEVATTSESDSGDESSISNLIHETLLPNRLDDSTSRPRTQKIRPSIPNESAEERNSRTVFVGNLNVECVGNKALIREFLDHLLNPLSAAEPLAPRSRIASYRFRNLPLATPITEPRPENRSEKRSKTWRETQALTGTDSSEKAILDNPDGGRAGRRGARTLPESATTKLPEVKFLTPNQKRKVGYVTGDLHPDAKSCVAFVVISPPDTTEAEEDVSSLTAQELAKLISEKSDGTSFMGHVLRCDLAGTKYPGQSSQTDAQIISPDEQRRTLYIGGLDFTEQEDSIRKAVESRLQAEKEGAPREGGSWVERVRVVRDKTTALGKGFAYVLLKTQDAVEEMLALEAKSFKIGKRKVRLQKYVVPGKCAALKKLGRDIETKTKGRSEKSNNPSQKRPKLDLTQDVPAVYAGPDLSKKLKSLTKDERKSIKSSTPARVERRMLKKQAKLKMKIADQQIDRKIQAVKSRPLKKTMSKPTTSVLPKQSKLDKKDKSKKSDKHKKVHKSQKT